MLCRFEKGGKDMIQSWRSQKGNCQMVGSVKSTSEEQYLKLKSQTQMVWTCVQHKNIKRRMLKLELPARKPGRKCHRLITLDTGTQPFIKRQGTLNMAKLTFFPF